MELRIVVASGDGTEREVAVTSQPGHLVRDLAEALGDHLGAAVGDLYVDEGRQSRRLDPATQLRAAGLRHGQLVRLAPRAAVDVVWEAVVVGGPDAGRTWPLPPGPAVLGRSDEADLTVQDPFVSRRHVRLDVATDEVRATDLGSVNGTLVAGQPIADDEAIGERPLELGSTLVAVGRRSRVEPPAGDVRGQVVVDWASPDPGLAPLPDLAALARAAGDGGRGLWRGGTVGATGPVVRVGWDDGPRPVALRLGDGAVVIDGSEEASNRAAAAVVLQAAAAHAPSQLSIGVLAASTNVQRWGWAHWLPHARGAGPGLVVDAGGAAAALRDVMARRGAHEQPALLLVVDRTIPGVEEALPAVAAAAGVRLVGVGGGAASWAGQRVTIDRGSGMLGIAVREGVPGPSAGANGLEAPGADGVAPDVATRVARSLAPLCERSVASEPTKQAPTLGDVVPGLDAASVAAAWSAGRPRAAAIGVGAAGPVLLDLETTDGAVAVTGSARAAGDVALAVVLGLAAAVGPDRLATAALLTDADAGRWEPLQRLPQVIALAGAAAAARLGQDLEVEVQRRLAALDAAGVATWDDLRLADADAGPRLLMVVDGRSAQDPAVRAVLARAAEVGHRRLGLHLLVVGEPPAEVGPAATTSVLASPDGSVELRADTRSVPARAIDLAPRRPEADDRVEVSALVAGRVSRTAGHTSLLRQPQEADDVATAVEACVLAASTLGLARATWTPASDGPKQVTRTFLFTDIVGSTRLVEVIGDAAWADLVGWHDRALRAAFAAHDGEEVDHAGDGFLVAFAEAADAVACAQEIQRALEQHRTEHGFSPRVRVGGHTTSVVRAEKYKGHGLHVAARVGALADGDEIVFSAATIDAVSPRPRTVRSRVVEVKGASEPIEVLDIEWR